MKTVGAGPSSIEQFLSVRASINEEKGMNYNSINLETHNEIWAKILSPCV
jgi:hypothetical protein